MPAGLDMHEEVPAMNQDQPLAELTSSVVNTTMTINDVSTHNETTCFSTDVYEGKYEQRGAQRVKGKD